MARRLGAAQLDATAGVPGTFAYTPAAGTVLGAGTARSRSRSRPAIRSIIRRKPGALRSSSRQATPSLTWSPPASITYGTALGSAQLDAQAGVAGTFAYTPAAGTVPGAGSRTLSVTFTPTDSNDYTTATATTTIDVAKATPTVQVADGGVYDGNPIPATATVAGLDASPASSLEGVGPALTYFAGSTATGTPIASAPTMAGTYTVVASFPGSVDYAAAAAQATFAINPATPTIAWGTPASIAYGSALGPAQLDATADVPGDFSYTPDVGTILGIGRHTLSVTFTPSDSTDYATATATTTINVAGVTPTLTWAAPAARSIWYGPGLEPARCYRQRARDLRLHPSLGDDPGRGDPDLAIRN